MKNNPLDDIVRCNVEISSPASSDASFNSILLISYMYFPLLQL